MTQGKANTDDFAAQAFKTLIEFRDSVQESRDKLYQTRETQDLKPAHDKAIAPSLPSTKPSWNGR